MRSRLLRKGWRLREVHHVFVTPGMNRSRPRDQIGLKAQFVGFIHKNIVLEQVDSSLRVNSYLEKITGHVFVARDV
jgi:hypothetical protein